jgi:RHS repeat-associated protein
MNLLKAWNAIAARAKNRPADLRRKRRTSRRALHEPLEVRQLLTATPLYWVGGATSSWNTTDKNWSSSPGSSTADSYWADGDQAVFGGAAGTFITIDSTVAPDSIEFTTDGYQIDGPSGSLALSGTDTIDVGAGLTETISAGLNCTGGMEKTGTGAVTLSGTSTGNGVLLISGGKVQVTGTVSNPVTIGPAGTLSGPSGHGGLSNSALTGPVTNNGGTYDATLYHVVVLNSQLNVDTELTDEDHAEDVTVHGTLSYTDGQGGWTLALSAKDAVFKVLSATVTSDSDGPHGSSQYQLSPSEPAFTLSIGPETPTGNANITFSDPNAGYYFDPEDQSAHWMGYGGGWNLDITSSTLQDCPICTTPFASAEGSGDGGPFAGFADGGLAGNAGQFNLAGSRLASDNFGVGFGESIFLTNQPAMATGNSGKNVSIGETPQVLHVDVNTYIVVGVGQVRYFDKIGGLYRERGPYHDRLIRDPNDPNSGDFIFSDSSGNTTYLNNFSGSILGRGGFAGRTDVGGDAIQVQYADGTGDIPAGLIESITIARAGMTDTFTYTYTSGGNFNDPTAGEVKEVDFDRTVGTHTFHFEKATFEYYPLPTTYVDAGQLKRVKIQKMIGGTFQTIDTEYYRYDSSGNLIYVFSNASYTQLLKKYGSDQNIDQADPTNDPSDPDSLAPYADVAVQYDGLDVVGSITSKGTGCSQCMGGLGLYSYATSTNSDPEATNNYNAWTYDTTQTDANNVLHSEVYSNFLGETILSIQYSGSQTLKTYYKYDSAGRLILEAGPSAVASYVPYQTDLGVILNSSDGLINLTDYYPSDPNDANDPYTPATTTTAGGVAGMIQDTKIQHGTSGTPILQSSMTYLVHSDANGVTIYPVAASTVYQTTDGGNPETTTYAYNSWYPNTNQVQDESVTLPTVTDQTPSGSDTTETFYNLQGRPIWEKDAAGYINYTAYDAATGAVIETIQDVDSNHATGLPAGWSILSGTGITHANLTTTSLVDSTGRTVEQTDPFGRAQFTVYDDVALQTRHYAGWTDNHDGTYTQQTNPPPVEISTDNLAIAPAYSVDGYADTYSETLTMAQIAPSSSTQSTQDGSTPDGITLPMGAEPIANVLSLSRSITNQAGQVVETDAYYDLTTDHSTNNNATWTYAAGPNPRIGSAWNPAQPTTAANFYVSTFGYDDFGRQDRVQNPNNTIRRTAYDLLGRESSTWIGTNDAAGSNDPSNEWSPTNQSASANMVELSANFYDNYDPSTGIFAGTSGVGDSNLTETINYQYTVPAVWPTTAPTATQSRISLAYFDWRDRQVASKDGALMTAAFGGGATEDLTDESSDGVSRAIQYSVFDNLDEATASYTFAGSSVAPATIGDYVNDAAPYTTSAVTLLRRSYATTAYDLQGRANLTTVYNVVQSGSTAGSTTGSPETSTIYFDPRGLVDHTLDALSNSTVHTYDGVGREVSLTLPDPDGPGTSNPLTSPITLAAYNTDGSVSVTDPNGHTRTTFYDAAGRVSEIDEPAIRILPNGSTSLSSYTSGTIIPKTTYVYAPDGTVQTVIDANNNYAATTNSTTTNPTIDYRDPLGRLVREVLPHVNTLSGSAANTDSPSDATPTTLWTYDGDGNILTVTNGNNAVMGYAYNIFDQQVAVYLPDPSTGAEGTTAASTSSFDTFGELLSTTEQVTSSLSATTTYSYNLLGEKVQAVLPYTYALQSGATNTVHVQPTTTWAYDPLGNMLSTTDANANNSGGYSTTYAYGWFGMLTSQTLPNPTGGTSPGPTTGYAYDLDNELLTVTDGLNNVTSMTYDHDGRKLSVKLPNPSNGTSTGGPTYNYAYWPGGQLKTVTDAFNDVTSYFYDARNQIYQVSQPVLTTGAAGGPTVTYYHDANGNVTAESDAETTPNTTFFQFDALNRISSQSETVALSWNGTSAVTDTAVRHSFYDNAGNLTRTIDADGRRISYQYDFRNERTSEKWFASATATTPTNTISDSYFAGGALYTAVDAFDPNGSFTGQNSGYTFGVNALGQVTSVDNNGSQNGGTLGVPDVALNAQYDLNGNRTALSATVGGTADFKNLVAFDTLNRETQITQQGQSGGYAVGYKRTIFGLDAANRTTSITDNTASAQVVNGSYTFDHDNRLTDLSWRGTGGPYGGSGQYFDEFQYSFDTDSRTASYANPFYANENLTYTYDHDNQLTSAATSYGGYGGYGGAGGGTYGWDGNGDTTVSGRVTGAGNRLLFDGTYTYQYDYAGHVAKRYTTTAETDYGWDFRGRLISVKDFTKSGTTVTQTREIDYWYDAFDRLLGRLVTPYSGGNPSTSGVTITRFVYDSPSAGSGQGDAVMAFTGNQSLTDRYLWGPAVDQILADERFSPSGSNQMPSSAGTTYWALGDNEWSVRDWIANGSLVDHVVYGAFGTIYSQSSTTVTFAFMHNGTFADSATGLEWHQARWYNPGIQRWMSEDPSGLGPDSNPYRYCKNSPTNGSDPTGLDDNYTIAGPRGSYILFNVTNGDFQETLASHKWSDPFKHGSGKIETDGKTEITVSDRIWVKTEDANGFPNGVCNAVTGEYGHDAGALRVFWIGGAKTGGGPQCPPKADHQLVKIKIRFDWEIQVASTGGINDLPIRGMVTTPSSVTVKAGGTTGNKVDAACGTETVEFQAYLDSSKRVKIFEYVPTMALLARVPADHGSYVHFKILSAEATDVPPPGNKKP